MPLLVSFNGGEISPSAFGRRDNPKVNASAKTMRNFLCNSLGAASNRGGTAFVAEVRDSSKRHRLIPFEYSTEQAYCLEFGNGTMRVYMDGASVLEGNKTITGATQANPVVITSVAHGYSNGDWVQISGVGGMTEINGKVFKVNNVAADTFELQNVDGVNIDGTGYGVYTSGGVANRVYQISTPYSDTDLPLLKFAQSADTMYLTHPDYYPRKLTRTGHTSWSLVIAPLVDGPYKPVSIGDSDIILTPADRIGNDVTVTSSADFFTPAMVGTPLRLGYPDLTNPNVIFWGYGIIDQYTNSTTARFDIINPFGAQFIQNNDFDTGLGYWVDYSTGNSTLTWDAVNKRAVMTKGNTGNVTMSQEFVFVPHLTCTFTIDLAQVDGTVRVYMGTTLGATDVMSIKTETTPGIKTYTVSPTVELIYLTIDDVGSTNGDIETINSVSFTQEDLSTNEWRQAAWSDDNGYPNAVTFYEQRLAFAGTIANPQTIWLSKTGNQEDFGFSSPILDSDSLNYTLDAYRVNAIDWMLRSGALILGTRGGIWKIAGTGGGSLTPTSVDAKDQTNFPSSYISPLRVGNSILFLERGAQTVRDLQYSYAIDSFEGLDRTVFVDHFFDEGETIEEWAYAHNPNRVAWCIRSDGTALGLTYNREHEVYGWHRHDTSGGYFESVCTIPGATSDTDVYFIVKRTINGSTRRYVEFLRKPILDKASRSYYLVDCGLSYSGSPVLTLSNLDHLEGETVSILADGGVQTPKQVVNGSITLDVAASIIHVGLPITSDLEPLSLDEAVEAGDTVARIKVVSEARVYVKDTRGGVVGQNTGGPLDLLRFYDEGVGEAIELQTGFKDVKINASHGMEATLLIRQTDPLPMTVLSIKPLLTVTER